VEIVRGGSDRIPQLEPLWKSLHDHHAVTAPELQALGPVRPARESWAIRARLYKEWLAEPDAFVLLAIASGEAIGYALVHMRAGEETWNTGEHVAELETLTVLPEHRGRGIGTALLQGVSAELERIGVSHVAVSVISANEGARRFYESRGLMPFLATYIGRIQKK
jgi:GNAT superfamily N-acetyltransferase